MANRHKQEVFYMTLNDAEVGKEYTINAVNTGGDEEMEKLARGAISELTE